MVLWVWASVYTNRRSNEKNVDIFFDKRVDAAVDGEKIIIGVYSKNENGRYNCTCMSVFFVLSKYFIFNVINY